MNIRFTLLLLYFMLLLPAVAQQSTYAPKMWENWSITLSGGVHHPAIYSFTKELIHPSVSIKFKKQYSPVLSFLLECEGYQGNMRLEQTYYNRLMAIMGSEFNLMNLFGSYSGRPRIFEFETKFGIGWGHTFRNRQQLSDENYLVSKVGGNFIFNLGRKRMWSIVVQPALIYDLRSSNTQHHEAYNINQADIQTLLGITYHFGNGHGGHYPALVNIPRPILPQPTPDPLQEENAMFDMLLDTINTLKCTIAQQEQDLTELQERLQSLQNKSNNVLLCDSDSTPQPQEGSERKVLECFITFRAGRATVGPTQFPNLERVATCLHQHPHARLDIRGYASPDGDPDINAKMAQQRAEIVKTLLIAQYGIQPERITAQGGGIKQGSSNKEWNRVAVCTIVE